MEGEGVSRGVRTHVGFVVTGLKDEFLGVMLPVLHRSRRGGLVGRTQCDGLAPLACLEQRQPIARQDASRTVQDYKMGRDTRACTV